MKRLDFKNFLPIDGQFPVGENFVAIQYCQKRRGKDHL